ncbi:MAG: hypothetical protein V1750_04160, partial [Acidobacteriota bacterium]
VVISILVFVGLDIALRALRRRHGRAPIRALPAAMLEPRPPQGIFLHPAHSWLRISSDGTLRVGVDEFLAEALGEVEAVKMPRRGEKAKRGEALVTLTVGGRELAIVAPAAGEVIALNERATSSPYLVGRDPYGAGWLVSLWTADQQEAIRSLRIGAGATAFLRQEVQRLADFLTGHRPLAPAAVLADGGLPLRGAARALDDEGWGAFAAEFVPLVSEKG